MVLARLLPSTRSSMTRRSLSSAAQTAPRFMGIPSFMRCPIVADPSLFATDVDVALLGVPFDGGVSNRPGARHGPRAVRDQSSLVRGIHHLTRVNPFDLAKVADVGDVPFSSLTDLPQCHRDVVAFASSLVDADATLLAVGGDHSITFPLLEAAVGALAGSPRHAAAQPALQPDGTTTVPAPLACIHIDAHTDTWDTLYGEQLSHGAPFRRAVEAGLLDPSKVVQIGIRGAQNFDEGWRYCEEMGFTVIWCEDVHREGVDAAVARAREIVGDAPTYLSFDIDAIDPAFAPGTGTPEIGGMATWQAQELVRGFRGLNLVGGDMVEVSPPWDTSNLTAITGGTVAYEILCLLAESRGFPVVEDWRDKRRCAAVI